MLAKGLQMGPPRDEVHLRSGLGQPPSEIATDAARPINSDTHAPPPPPTAAATGTLPLAAELLRSRRGPPRHDPSRPQPPFSSRKHKGRPESGVNRRVDLTLRDQVRSMNGAHCRRSARRVVA